MQSKTDLRKDWKSQNIGRSEGFPNEIFRSCTLWDRAQSRWESCWVHRCHHMKIKVDIQTRKLLLKVIKGFLKVLESWWETFENGDRGSAQNSCGRLEHSGLAWGAIFGKMLTFKEMHTFQHSHIPSF